jgi:hypothetical protein
MRNPNDREAVRVVRRGTALLRAGAAIAALGGALTLGAATPSGRKQPDAGHEGQHERARRNRDHHQCGVPAGLVQQHRRRVRDRL